ncbi:MAG: hypothetical protein NC489_21130 [Ruminococcus flavefaciens]|nr:hypothetical protein [Ruminococcus flavefaciens]
MATVIRSMNDLTKILESRVQKALEMTQQEIYEVIQKHITEYYQEYSPRFYQRTWDFLNSLIKTKVVKSANGLSCTVEIDRAYLSGRYRGGATGLEVATYANEHSHGGVYDDDFGQFWDDAMEELGLEPGIRYLMKNNLKKYGVNVK